MWWLLGGAFAFCVLQFFAHLPEAGQLVDGFGQHHDVDCQDDYCDGECLDE